VDASYLLIFKKRVSFFHLSARIGLAKKQAVLNAGYAIGYAIVLPSGKYEPNAMTTPASVWWDMS